MSDLTLDQTANARSFVDKTCTGNGQPIIIDIYGLPGSGKTFLLNQLQGRFEKDEFAYYEGSQITAKLVPGGLESFQTLESNEKMQWRSRAVEHIGKECAGHRQTGIVTGHCRFWSEEEVEGQSICTKNGLDTYTYILYLDVPVEIIVRRQLNDVGRIRTYSTARWKIEEQSKLRELCREHNILFSTIIDEPGSLDKVIKLIGDFSKHDKQHNLRCAERALDEALYAIRWFER